MPTDRTFLELSAALTGVSDLPLDLAGDYEGRIREAGMGAVLDRLLSAYRHLQETGRLDHESLANALFNTDAEMKKAAQQVIVLWYSSALIENIDQERPQLRFGKPQHHFRALLWDVIGAHPPALSGGYFGYWRYPPENRLP